MAEKCENNYKWVSGYESEDISDEYEKLIRPDGTRVTVITEPEDRISYRDLAPITNELNSLQAENKRLAGEVKRGNNLLSEMLEYWQVMSCGCPRLFSDKITTHLTDKV